MKIGVFTHYDTYFEPVAAITVPIMREYCERHGYHFEAHTERLSERRVVWDKVSLLLDNLHSYYLTFHIDCDVLITNHNLNIIPPAISLDRFYSPDVILSQDCNGWNMGVMGVRNCDSAEKWLLRAWHVGERAGIGSEQHAMYVAMHERPPHTVLTLPQSRSNAYPLPEYDEALPEGCDGAWNPGAFLMHLPGMPNDKRVEIFKRYLPEIVR